MTQKHMLVTALLAVKASASVSSEFFLERPHRDCAMQESWPSGVDWWWSHVLLLSLMPLAFGLYLTQRFPDRPLRKAAFLCHRRSSLEHQDAKQLSVSPKKIRQAIEILFPVPKSLTLNTYLLLYVTFAFLMTVTTPLMRLVTGKWWAHLSLLPALYRMNLFSCPPAFPAYPDPGSAEHRATDRSFGPHALAGLTWLCAIGFQLVFSRKFSKRVHRVFGYVCTLIFACHMLLAFRSLYLDVEKHTLMNKVMLAWTPLTVPR